MPTLSLQNTLLIIAISSCAVFGQSEDTLATYPCTINIPSTPSFIYCENGKEIKCQNFAARKSRNKIRIVGNKPENTTSLLPSITLTFSLDTALGLHKSESNRLNTFAQKETMGGNIMYSQMHSGFCHVQITAIDDDYISGKFATTVFNTTGNIGQLISGVFKVPFRKE